MLRTAFDIPQKKVFTLLCEVAHFKSSTDVTFQFLTNDVLCKLRHENVIFVSFYKQNSAEN